MGELIGLVGVMIPVIALSIPFFAIWTKHQRQLAEMQMQAPPVDDRQANYVRELEDRLRVLERIVTDKGYDVASQIEALRDDRAESRRLEEQKL